MRIRKSAVLGNLGCNGFREANRFYAERIETDGLVYRNGLDLLVPVCYTGIEVKRIETGERYVSRLRHGRHF